MANVLIFNTSEAQAGAGQKLADALGSKHTVATAGANEDQFGAVMMNNPDVVIVVGDPGDSNASQTLAALAATAMNAVNPGKPVLLVDAAKSQQADAGASVAEARQMTGTGDVAQLKLAKAKALERAGVQTLDIPLDVEAGVKAAVTAVDNALNPGKAR